VAGGGDPGGPVDVDADIALLGEVRRSRVDAHPDPDRSSGQPLERVGGFLRSTGGGALCFEGGGVLLGVVGIAVVAPFVMKSDDMGGASAMSAGTLSREEFARRSDANCREFGEFAARLGNPQAPAGIERFMDRFLPEFWRALLAQGQLAPPRDEQATAKKWMNAMAAYGRDQEAASRRGLAPRREGDRPRKREREHACNGSAHLSKELGMRVCFQ